MNKLLKAIELSEEIEQAVQEYDWDKVSNLDQIRQQVIISYYGEEKIIDPDLTEQLKKVNDSILHSLQHIRQETRSQQLGHKKGQRASKAYQSNQPKG